MLTNYKSQCESVVKSWIAEKSKCKLDNLSFEDYQEFVADCRVEITHSLDVECKQEVVTGSTDKQGELVSSKAEYDKIVESYLAQESSNPKHLKVLFDKIEQSAYAQHKTKSTLLTTSAIIYEHSCQTCKGNTEQKCGDCKGQGEVRCDRCGGKGEYRCSKCDGRGEIKCDGRYCDNGRCRWCDGRGRLKYSNSDGWYECEKCKGIGKCKKCNGKGTVWCDRCKGGFIECGRCNKTGYVRCRTCYGETIIKCKTCNGTNKIIEIAQICTTTTPKYTQNYQENIDEKVKAFIEKHIMKNAAEIANITRTELRQDEKERCVVEIYQIQVPYAKFNIAFNGEKFTWLIYGNNLQIAQGQHNDDLLSAILAKYIDTLAEFAEKSSLMDLNLIKKSQPMVENFMNSQINQSIIQADIDDNSKTYEDRINAIQSKLKDKSAISLSKEYIEKVIDAFDTMADNFCSSVTITALILAFVVSFLVAFFMPLFIPLGWSVISTYAIFAIFIRFGVRYKAKTIVKNWGNNLYSWVRMFGYIGIKYARLYTIIGIVVVYFAGSYVNAAKLREMFISMPTTKQRQSSASTQRQAPPQPTLVTPKCNDSTVLADIKNAQRQGILETIEKNTDLWANIQKRNQAKGVEFASVAEYVSGMRLDYSDIETNVRDEVRHRVECSARLSVSHSLMSNPQIWAFQYAIQAKELDNGNNINITNYQRLDKPENLAVNGSVASSNTASSSAASENSNPAINQSENSSVASVRLKTNDEYVNLRKAPSGEVLTPIYKKDFDKIVIKKLGVEGKWVRVRYYAPNVSDESKAITGYIHISQIDESSL